jgi:hypothetical protein
VLPSRNKWRRQKSANGFVAKAAEFEARLVFLALVKVPLQETMKYRWRLRCIAAAVQTTNPSATGAAAEASSVAAVTASIVGSGNSAVHCERCWPNRFV